MSQPGLRAHGTMSGYFNHGCRCEACRAVGSDYFRRRRAGLAQALRTCSRCGIGYRGSTDLCLDCDVATR